MSAACGLNRLFKVRHGQQFGILMYHRVAEHVPGVEAPTWNVTPEALRRQLAGLLALGYMPWSLSKLIAAHRESVKIPPNVFAVTFDDGYENNFLQAWPILRNLNVPATIFLATKYLDCDQPFWCDDWTGAGLSGVPRAAWRPLRTSQCAEMLASGLIELGAHTHTHEHFLGRAEAFHSDLRQCLDELHDRFGLIRPAFAFPFGEYDQEMVDVSKQLEFACSLTTHVRPVHVGDDPHEWGRFHVEPDDTASTLAAKLSGWYSSVIEPAKTFMGSFAAIARQANRLSSRRSSNGSYGDLVPTKKALAEQ